MRTRKTLEQWKEELVGKQFGRLYVIDVQPHIRKSTGRKDGFEVVCQCTCGKEKTIILNNLLNGNTTSCGCVAIESSKKNLVKAHTWIFEHPEEVKELRENSVNAMLEWQMKHPEETKKNQLQNICRANEWKKENPERVSEIDQLRLEKAHDWREKHPKEALEISRENIKKAHKWLKEHPEEYKKFNHDALEKAHEWMKNNKDRVRENSLKGRLVASTLFSKEETEIYNYLLSLGYSVERQFLLEEHLFDFKIGNFLIEYNGSTYHYTEYRNIENPESKAPPCNPRETNYHKILYDLAVSNGYKLIQIWDYMWFNNRIFVEKLISEQLSGVANYKDYIENSYLNNDYGFVVEGERIEPMGVWISTGEKKIVTEEYTKSKVLVYNSGYVRIK